MNNFLGYVIGIPLGVGATVFWLGLIYVIIREFVNFVKNSKMYEEKYRLDNKQMAEAQFLSDRELIGKMTEYGFLKEGWKSFNYKCDEGVLTVKYQTK